ncbi:MAG: TldD/PmbA family protein [Chromatiales bacterium]|jgi:predicted Zn-dependent protease
MAILNKDEARSILEKVMKYSQSEECEANLNGNAGGNIRYALNTVTTAGQVNDTTLVVQSGFGKRVGTATVNEFDEGSIEKVVRRSEELARLAPENPEWVSIEGPHKYGASRAYFESTDSIDPDYRAKAAAGSIEPAKKNKATAAGFLEDGTSFQAMLNSKGLFAYHIDTGCDFSVTMRTDDLTGSGWATSYANDVSRLDTAATSQRALDKALMSRDAKALEPGKYTVILEPNACVQLISNMAGAFDARLADEGRSFLSKDGGGTRLGEKMFDERVTLYSDPLHPDVPVAAWDQDGRPRERVVWIDKGVVKNLFYSRFWAQEKKVAATPPPGNGIMEGGKKSTAELIKSTERGILVTRLWYIRTVDPQTQLYTGLTRDGTFYIEGGEIKYPVKNFRFNESPVIMLNNLEELGTPERVSAGNPIMMPAMKIREFTFTSLSDAV